MWHYLYFMHHLKRKPIDEFTGQESYVLEKIEAKDMGFFPLGKSMDLIAEKVPGYSVSEPENDTKEFTNVVVNRLDQLEDNFQRLERKLSTLAAEDRKAAAAAQPLHQPLQMRRANTIAPGAAEEPPPLNSARRTSFMAQMPGLGHPAASFVVPHA